MEVRSFEKCMRCIGSFQVAISTLRDRGHDKERHLVDKTRDELERFSLWAGNIGALNAPTSPLSLEYRLRDAQDILDHIIELLDDLHEAASDLQRCLDRQAETDGKPPGEHAANDEDDEDEAEALVSEAGSYITRLFRITKIIRQAAPTDRFTKALSRERLKLDDYFDISHVGAKFPKLAVDDQTWLRQRLGRAITHRRQFLHYTRDHRDKLESSGTPDDGPMKTPGPRLDLSQLPGGDMARSEGASRPSTFFTKASTIDLAQVSSVSLHLDQESDIEDDAKSYTTISRSVDGDLETSLSGRVPKLSELQSARELESSVPKPKENWHNPSRSIFDIPGALDSLRENNVDLVTMKENALHEFSNMNQLERDPEVDSYLEEVKQRAQTKREIECPFCCEIKKFGNERAWRRHVYSDLRPYVCTYPDCSKPYFGDVNEWFNHEMQCHRVSYACQLCQGRVYKSDKPYLDHVRRRHPTFQVDGGEQALLNIGKQPVQQILAEDCPCCTDWTDRLRQRLPSADTSGLISVTPVVFKRHLASHLEQLALFALPLPNSAGDAQDSNVAWDVEREEGGKSEASFNIVFDSQPPSPVERQPTPSPVEQKPTLSPVERQPKPLPVEQKPKLSPVEQKSKHTFWQCCRCGAAAYPAKQSTCVTSDCQHWRCTACVVYEEWSTHAPSPVERQPKPSPVERQPKPSPVERQPKPSPVERQPKLSPVERQETHTFWRCCRCGAAAYSTHQETCVTSDCQHWRCTGCMVYED